MQASFKDKKRSHHFTIKLIQADGKFINEIIRGGKKRTVVERHYFDEFTNALADYTKRCDLRKKKGYSKPSVMI